jgi:hypothetical protein
VVRGPRAKLSSGESMHGPHPLQPIVRPRGDDVAHWGCMTRGMGTPRYWARRASTYRIRSPQSGDLLQRVDNKRCYERRKDPDTEADDPFTPDARAVSLFLGDEQGCHNFSICLDNRLKIFPFVVQTRQQILSLAESCFCDRTNSISSWALRSMPFSARTRRSYVRYSRRSRSSLSRASLSK